ncbi:MAG: DUF1501 domain-containing protein [Alcanivoracaceae bacterium]|nr:DUF1501 domain-containing protein [Alcanivoracaceae bacterium]
MLSRRNFLTLGKQSKITDDQVADILIYVFQRGAADGLNLVVPYADINYYTNRPNLAIRAPDEEVGSAIDLDGFFGLNPDLSALLPIYEKGDLAMVHACGSEESTHSHFQTQAFIDRGTVDVNVGTGWLARYANAFEVGQPNAFKAISMSEAIPASLAGADQVVALSSIDGFNILAPESEVDLISEQLFDLFSGEQSLDNVAQATFSALDSIATLNSEDFPIENDAQYPASSFGNKLRDLAILIKSGIGVETASVDIGGWDTHDSQATILTQLAQDYANSLAAFYTDMGEHMGNISIITITEFGRRVAENGSGGTDHGTGNVAFIMGGGVNGGQVYSDWPGLDNDNLVGPGDLMVTTDYRTIVAELMDKRMFFNDHDILFPGFVVPEYVGMFKDKREG